MKSNQHTRTSLKLTEDARLLAGLRGAIEHIASRHGLEQRDSTEFGQSAEQACRNALGSLSRESAWCNVILDEFPDRLELIVECLPNCAAQRSDERKFVKYFHKNPAKI